MITFLKLKNWQVFSLAIIIPLIVSSIISLLFDFGEYSGDMMLSIFIGCYYLVFVLWNLSVIKIFNKDKKILSNRQLNWMKFAAFCLILYGFFLVIPFRIKTTDNYIVALTPLFMLAGAFSIFFTTFCSAKTIKTLQHQETTRTADIVIEMLILLYFPIGIWWVQKRVNNLINQK